jgi:hypothetical protein
MRRISRSQHAQPWYVSDSRLNRSAARRLSDPRRRSLAPQAWSAPRRQDRGADPVAAAPEAAARLPLPLGYSLGFGGL